MPKWRVAAPPPHWAYLNVLWYSGMLKYGMVFAMQDVVCLLSTPHGVRRIVMCYAMVWYSMVWYGTVWYGMVQYGMV